MCIGVGSAGQLFHTNIAKKTKKSGYKCGFSGSISPTFVFNISRKVKKIIFSANTLLRRVEFVIWLKHHRKI